MQPRQPLTSIKIPNPTAGVIRTIQREGDETPPHLTNSLNVLPYDLLGRKRIAQREGVLPLYNLGTLNPNLTGLIQGMLPVGFIVAPGAIIGPPFSLPFSTWTAPTGGIVSTGNVYFGALSGSTGTVVPPVSSLSASFQISWSPYSAAPFAGGLPPAIDVTFRLGNVLGVSIQSDSSTSTGGYVLWLTYGVSQVTPGLYFSTSAGTITANVEMFAQYNAQQCVTNTIVNGVSFPDNFSILNPNLSTINIAFTGHGEGVPGTAISTSGQLEIS